MRKLMKECTWNKVDLTLNVPKWRQTSWKFIRSQSLISLQQPCNFIRNISNTFTVLCHNNQDIYEFAFLLGLLELLVRQETDLIIQMHPGRYVFQWIQRILHSIFDKSVSILSDGNGECLKFHPCPRYQYAFLSLPRSPMRIKLITPSRTLFLFFSFL